MSDNPNLKPCPFCGCDDCRVQVETYGKWARVFCPLCGASTMSVQVGYNDPALAVKLWNERADDRIAELEANIEILKDQQREARNILIDKKLQIDSLYEAGYKLQQRIAELEEKQRWRVVANGELPEDGEVVWLWDGNNLGMGYYLVLAGQFMDRDTPLRRIKPTHWMPLPESPNDTQTQTIVYRKESEE